MSRRLHTKRGVVPRPSRAPAPIKKREKPRTYLCLSIELSDAFTSSVVRDRQMDTQIHRNQYFGGISGFHGDCPGPSTGIRLVADPLVHTSMRSRWVSSLSKCIYSYALRLAVINLVVTTTSSWIQYLPNIIAVSVTTCSETRDSPNAVGRTFATPASQNG